MFSNMSGICDYLWCLSKQLFSTSEYSSFEQEHVIGLASDRHISESLSISPGVPLRGKSESPMLLLTL